MSSSVDGTKEDSDKAVRCKEALRFNSVRSIIAIVQHPLMFSRPTHRLRRLIYESQAFIKGGNFSIVSLREVDLCVIADFQTQHGGAPSFLTPPNTNAEQASQNEEQGLRNCAVKQFGTKVHHCIRKNEPDKRFWQEDLARLRNRNSASKIDSGSNLFYFQYKKSGSFKC